jgi:hypothetical protein
MENPTRTPSPLAHSTRQQSRQGNPFQTSFPLAFPCHARCFRLTPNSCAKAFPPAPDGVRRGAGEMLSSHLRPCGCPLARVFQRISAASTSSWQSAALSWRTIGPLAKQFWHSTAQVIVCSETHDSSLPQKGQSFIDSDGRPTTRSPSGSGP